MRFEQVFATVFATVVNVDVRAELEHKSFANVVRLRSWLRMSLGMPSDSGRHTAGPTGPLRVTAPATAGVRRRAAAADVPMTGMLRLLSSLRRTSKRCLLGSSGGKVCYLKQQVALGCAGRCG